MAQDPNREELATFANQVDSALNPPEDTAAEATADQPVATQSQPAQSPLASEFKVFANGILNFVFPAFPSLREIYTPEVVDGLCQSGAAVCDKRDWLQNGLGGAYAEELTFIMMTVPLAVATKQAVQHDNAIRKARQKNPDGNGMADAEQSAKAAA